LPNRFRALEVEAEQIAVIVEGHPNILTAVDMTFDLIVFVRPGRKRVAEAAYLQAFLARRLATGLGLDEQWRLS
jgi:hypothetical protein